MPASRPALPDEIRPCSKQLQRKQISRFVGKIVRQFGRRGQTVNRQFDGHHVHYGLPRHYARSEMAGGGFGIRLEKPLNRP
jgi:hypothetical protein